MNEEQKKVLATLSRAKQIVRRMTDDDVRSVCKQLLAMTLFLRQNSAYAAAAKNMEGIFLAAGVDLHIYID